MNKKNLILIMVIVVFSGLPAAASAQGLLPACAKDVKAVLQLSCFLNLMVSISNWILGITGSLALLFFVYGGFLFLISHGNPEHITKGKTILTQATIGIIIIFGAYLAVNFLVANVLKAKFTTEIPQEAAPATPIKPFSAGTDETKSTIKEPTTPPGQCNCICQTSAGTTGATPGLVPDASTCQQKCKNYLQSFQSCYSSQSGAQTTTEPYDCWCGNTNAGPFPTYENCYNECGQWCINTKLSGAPTCQKLK